MPSKKKLIVYQFKPLEDEITYSEGKLLLDEIISDWYVLSKRYDLKEDDNATIQRCQFYAAELIKRFSKLEMIHLHDYYDEAIADYLGKEYIVQRDKISQIKAGFNVVIFAGKGVYLFPF